MSSKTSEDTKTFFSDGHISFVYFFRISIRVTKGYKVKHANNLKAITIVPRGHVPANDDEGGGQDTQGRGQGRGRGRGRVEVMVGDVEEDEVVEQQVGTKVAVEMCKEGTRKAPFCTGGSCYAEPS